MSLLVLELLRILCFFLAAAGLLFVVMDLRTRFDYSLRVFGITLLVLSAMAAIDLYVNPSSMGPESKLFWHRVSHVLICLLSPFYVHYVLLLMRRRGGRFLHAYFGAALVVAVSVFSDASLKMGESDYIRGPLYYGLALPFIVFTIALVAYLFSTRMKFVEGKERFRLRVHLFGTVFLGACGVLDMVGIGATLTSAVPSMKILGVVGFGIMSTLVFMEKFLDVLIEKDAVFKKLQAAYQELEQANSLKELGQSTAIINHEIKNHLFMIQGHAQLLAERETLSEKGEKILGRITQCVEKLNRFSHEILDLSKARIITDKRPINLASLVHSTIEKFFSEQRSCFVLESDKAEQFIHGDWGKLENVLVNLLRNSLEAAEPGVESAVLIRIESTERVMLMSVEDNGTGCSEENLPTLFKAFATTKKHTGGTGLGLSFSRTIVEGHGGRISAYSKNLQNDGQHGLIVQLTFPIYTRELQPDESRKDPIVLVKDHCPDLPAVMQTFRNIQVNPWVVMDWKDLADLPVPSKNFSVLADRGFFIKRKPSSKESFRCFLLSATKSQRYIMALEGQELPEIFCESYVLNHMLPLSDATRTLSLKKDELLSMAALHPGFSA